MIKSAATTLVQLFSRFFSEQTRKKGQSYFTQRAVHNFQGSEDRASAQVVGSDVYDVHLQHLYETNELGISCTCPAFEDRLRCKHVWAVIRTADREGALFNAIASQCNDVIDFEPDYEDQIDHQDTADQFDKASNKSAGNFVRHTAGGQPIDLKGGSQAIDKLLQLIGLSGKLSISQLPPVQKQPKPPHWQKTLDAIGNISQDEESSRAFWNGGKQILFIINYFTDYGTDKAAVSLALQDRKANGEWSKPRAMRMTVGNMTHAPDPIDRKALETYRSLDPSQYAYAYRSGYTYAYNHYDKLPDSIPLTQGNVDYLLPLFCSTGRCFLRLSQYNDTPLIPLTWDEGPAWKLMIQVQEIADKKKYIVTGLLRRGDQTLPVQAPNLIMRGGVLIHGETAARFDSDDYDWIQTLRINPALEVPTKEGDQLARTLHLKKRSAHIDVPTQLHIEEIQGTPSPRLKLVKGSARGGSLIADHMRASVTYDYQGKLVSQCDAEDAHYIEESRQMIHRDRAAEAAAMNQLFALSFREVPQYDRRDGNHLEIKNKKLSGALPSLIAEGWHVEAEGNAYRSAGAINIQVSSGIDWFDLNGQAHFDDQQIDLPILLAALRRGDNTVILDDGTIGVLPEQWLKKYGMLASLGKETDGQLRFSQAQVGLLDALLAAMPEASCDALFEKARQRLRQFDGVKAADAPEGFGGELRPYQREGLGWLKFLREFRFGGCLADDMGLGKTIQVLAMLDARRLEKEAATTAEPSTSPKTKPRKTKRKKKGEDTDADAVAQGEAVATQDDVASLPRTSLPRPSLVVLPRSLVFNWQKEAEKFTPKLRLLDHTGIDRICRGKGDHTEALSEYDVILTTYGTLRADAAKLKDVKFDYVILDEAQAIKNSTTASAKAVRLLTGEHRLVMTGTPVENRLSDLWSIFEFLNPGMLGSASVFKLLSGNDNAQSPEARQLLSRALRPFILRRKKEQVARDLPARVEQTLYCELEPKQRKLYNELREHYRKSLLSKIDTDGMNKSKMHVLEALLRLRQAACHPGLIDKTMQGEPAAKIDVLLPQLQELIDEGHKVLVFSQFTSLLAIVRQRLDAEKITYEYLDGKTKDRQACVDRFQNDPACPLFLISLKAGGVGLNLTAAEHVFLLDPWWNPAVEAQAIDRAHRIGQTKQVFAFRIIARDTVEEKVLELQNSKRELADAIIGEDNSLITRLGREDLEMLLS